MLRALDFAPLTQEGGPDTLGDPTLVPFLFATLSPASGALSLSAGSPWPGAWYSSPTLSGDFLEADSPAGTLRSGLGGPYLISQCCESFSRCAGPLSKILAHVLLFIQHIRLGLETSSMSAEEASLVPASCPGLRPSPAFPRIFDQCSSPWADLLKSLPLSGPPAQGQPRTAGQAGQAGGQGYQPPHDTRAQSHSP